MDIGQIAVRGLTRREIRELEERGIVLRDVKSSDMEAVDTLLDLCCTPAIEDKEGLTPGQCLRLFERIVGKTYLDEDQVKNSGSPPS